MAKKSINIYMGVIGEAYVDKENAWAVLLAAKKNILDVQAILNAVLNVGRPLKEAINNAEEAINKAVYVYQLLKDSIYDADTITKYNKLYALLADLNENDFDDNFSNGGNIYTARENYAFAVSQQDELNDIEKIATELLDANRLNAVIRCKEYNIAKEIFESMVPDQAVSPEDLSDEIEGELLRRINAVNDNINYVNAVADEIINVSDDVERRINRIVSGDDEKVVVTNETLYWYAGNIDPRSSSLMVDGLGFTMNIDSETGKISYIKQDEDGKDIDFGIDGPLRANKWFHHPYHLIQDGYLTAGVDGGKLKAEYWYVAVPRYILTTLGLTKYDEYVTTALNVGSDEADLQTKEQWAIEKKNVEINGEKFVESLWPTKPTESDDLHLNDGGRHSYAAFIFDGANTNDNIVDEKFGWEMVTTEDNPLSINNIAYDVWRIKRNDYNTSRLNVYMKLGEAQAAAEADMDNRLAYYVGVRKPVLGESSMKNWTTEEANIYNKTLDGAISTACYKDYRNICSCTDYWTGPSIDDPDTNATYGIIRNVNAPKSDEINGPSAYLLNERVHFTEAEVNAYNAQLPGAVHGGDETINDGWHVKETNGETPILPIAERIYVKNEEGEPSKIFYVAIPAELSIFDAATGRDLLENEATSPYTLVYYNMTIDKIKYNVYITGNENAAFADVINKKGEQEIIDINDNNYYWYVGTTIPSNPLSTEENTGLNQWTSLGSSLPTSSIKVVKTDPMYIDHTWYIAAPTDANFILYNATDVASAEATWNKSTFNIESVSYTLWICKAQSDQAVAYLHK